MDTNKPDLFQHNFKELNEALFDFELFVLQIVWNKILETDKIGNLYFLLQFSSKFLINSYKCMYPFSYKETETPKNLGSPQELFELFKT